MKVNLQIFKDHLTNIFEYINDSLEKEYYQTKIPSKIKILYFFEDLCIYYNDILLTLKFEFYEGDVVGNYRYTVGDYSTYNLLEKSISQIIQWCILYADKIRDIENYTECPTNIAISSNLYFIVKYLYFIHQKIIKEGIKINNVKNILPLIENTIIDEYKINTIFYMKELKNHRDFCKNFRIGNDRCYSRQDYLNVIKKYHTDPLNYLIFNKER